MASASALKTASICIMVLTTMGLLIAADDASAARRLLGTELESSASENCPCRTTTWWCCFQTVKEMFSASENCLCSPKTWWCCPQAIRETNSASKNCLCSPKTWWCCPQTIRETFSASTNCLCSPKTWWCCPQVTKEIGGLALKPAEWLRKNLYQGPHRWIIRTFVWHELEVCSYLICIHFYTYCVCYKHMSCRVALIPYIYSKNKFVSSKAAS